jgi:hypothetical protein
VYPVEVIQRILVQRSQLGCADAGVVAYDVELSELAARNLE